MGIVFHSSKIIAVNLKGFSMSIRFVDDFKMIPRERLVVAFDEILVEHKAEQRRMEYKK